MVEVQRLMKGPYTWYATDRNAVPLMQRIQEDRRSTGQSGKPPLRRGLSCRLESTRSGRVTCVSVASVLRCRRVGHVRRSTLGWGLRRQHSSRGLEQLSWLGEGATIWGQIDVRQDG